MTQVCIRCGCSSFHYNRTRLRMECDSCGRPVYDAQKEAQLEQYDRAYTQAMGHLCAGNWSQTISILKPFWEQYPTEKKLYLGVLRAATRDFTDLSMLTDSERTAASEAWDKLVRLQGVSREMIRYAGMRQEMYRAGLRREANWLAVWIFLGAACSVCLGIAIDRQSVLTMFLLAGGLAGCIYKALCRQPVKLLRQLMQAMPDPRSNPFL